MTATIDLHNQFSATTCAPYPLVLTRGEGVFVYDETGNEYYDLTSGVAVTNFGHNHPRLVACLHEQANQIAIVSRLFHNKPLAELLAFACEISGMDKAIPMNTGAEAYETAVKVARKWGYVTKKIKQNSAEIIVCDHHFHGRTVTAVSASSVDQYKQYFGPLTPGFVSIPFNDLAALEQAITQNTAAFIVEPIQGEAGVVIPSHDYLQQCQALCQKHNLLFIVDEIQTGMGRTGKPFAFQYSNIHPDGVLMGKALGGGLLPISLFLAKEQVMTVLSPGDHGSTFGGNPLASNVAKVALEVLLSDKLCERSTELGEYFLRALKTFESPMIVDVRGRGLMIALEFDVNVVDVHAVFEQLVKRGVLTIKTRNNILRLLPPLIITTAQVDATVAIITDVINNLDDDSMRAKND